MLRTLELIKLNGFSHFCCLKRLLHIDCSEELSLPIKQAIEIKWRDEVEKTNFEPNEEKAKSYVLAMFPYPSGNLHMGHVRVYTISDTIARFQRLLGKNVFHPMGFDAFGLPAENAAMERKVSAEEWTKRNIESMRQQLKQLGCSFDWDHEIITCSKDYYKFTQYLFLLLFKSGLVYRKESTVNWDPVDKTVLADEQVDSGGRSWRSGALVETKILRQWFIRTTRFAHPLKIGLDDPSLEDWKDIINLQKHWIGDCDGANFEFKLRKGGSESSSLTVWTKYPELIGEAAFIAITPGNILALKEGGQPKAETRLDLVAVNPFTNRELPVYVTNNIEFDNGCDIKLGLPSMYECDKLFAESHNIEFESKFFSLGNSDEKLRICSLARDAGVGGYLTSSKLRDWLISRQRRWGTPIPVIHCEKCGPVPASFDDLPVLIRESEENRNAACPQCKGVGEWEKDTMDTFVDSSWYFLRFLSPRNEEEPFCKRLSEQMMPVDIYVGGKEHAVLHLYYARFMSHFLHSIGMLQNPEPFKRLLVQGMVMGKTYCVAETGKYISDKNVDFSGKQLKEIGSGLPVIESWEKMSKSKRNGVEPEDILKKYGVDTTRLLILSDVAPTSHKYWNQDSFQGILNWQKRIWSLIDAYTSAKRDSTIVDDESQLQTDENKIIDARNYYTKGVTFNYSNSHQLSVGISKLQGFTNSLKRIKASTMRRSLEFEKALAAFIIMLSPMTPHFASELWSILQETSTELGKKNDFVDLSKGVLKQRWPRLDDDYQLELIFKVNNAVKSSLKIPYNKIRTLTREEAFELALSEKKVVKFIQGCDVLNLNYNLVKDYEAILDISIDHHQKRSKNQPKIKKVNADQPS